MSPNRRTGYDAKHDEAFAVFRGYSGLDHGEYPPSDRTIRCMVTAAEGPHHLNHTKHSHNRSIVQTIS